MWIRVPSPGRLSAQIRYTTGGIPHILAHDWASLGFGYGYAFAKDNLCTMANDYVTVEAQRSRYFGPTGVDIQRGNGVVVSNLDSDPFIVCIQRSAGEFSSYSFVLSYTIQLPSGETLNFLANSFSNFVSCLVCFVLRS